uniref:Reverse transcriptase Ty1/copia-type domain-containing protein n=1 Tax=Solanum lycopersicum TaxID=4081 RepID=A0A3Q7G432_SOLLC
MENQKAIAVLPIPTIPTPAPPPTLNAYSRQLQPPSKLANLVDVSKSNRGAQSNLGIEVAQFGHGIVITQRKYALDILEDVVMLDAKHVDFPMNPNTKLISG